MEKKERHLGYWATIWQQFRQHYLGYAAFWVVALFCLVGIYAPFLASSKPLMVYWDGHWYFPLFRYLFFTGFFTKRLDIFYNLLMFTMPALVLAWIGFRYQIRRRIIAINLILAFQFIFFIYLIYRTPTDPAADPSLMRARQEKIQQQLQANRQNPALATPFLPDWEADLASMNDYAKLNLVLRYQQRKAQHQKFMKYEQLFADYAKSNGRDHVTIPTLWALDQQNEKEQKEQAQAIIDREKDAVNQSKEAADAYKIAEAQLKYLLQRDQWLEDQSTHLKYEVMPLLRPFHWEDDAGGQQALNRFVSWWDLTRINRKDMVAALIFGVRVSLSVGLTAVAIALAIGIPVGALSGYYGGKIDIITYRLIEIWEAMPTFFMLLMVVAFLQNKSIFLVIGVIGFFGWTGFSRFIRGEFFRQKQLPYVEACRSLGFNDPYIIFVHLLPNAIPPLLTLVPFAIMGAITSEAGLSFLGLGEEGSASWGVLMDEGRSAFPSESYLLWPPAILLTILLVAIALMGDALRDALDPKLHV